MDIIVRWSLAAVEFVGVAAAAAAITYVVGLALGVGV